ncbi:hypothetical protein BC332_18247 [Capsicum chinense]|nr:hypothetical protein BC332_18247 [Capsicum chinense]
MNQYWRGYDVDLLSYIDLTTEFTGNFGFKVIKQLLITGPNGEYFFLEDDSSIRTLQSILSRQFRVLQLFVVDEGIGTDAESEERDNNEPLPSDYDSEELELFRKKTSREVNDQLDMFLELEKVVDKETSRTWKWFAELLRSSLDLADGEGLTFMSDMQKIQPVRDSKFWKVDSAHAMEPPEIHKWLVDQNLREKEKRLSLGRRGMVSFKKKTENDMWTLWCNRSQSKKMSFVADIDGDKSEEDEQLTI